MKIFYTSTRTPMLNFIPLSFDRESMQLCYTYNSVLRALFEMHIKSKLFTIHLIHIIVIVEARHMLPSNDHVSILSFKFPACIER